MNKRLTPVATLVTLLGNSCRSTQKAASSDTKTEQQQVKQSVTVTDKVIRQLSDIRLEIDSPLIIYPHICGEQPTTILGQQAVVTLHCREDAVTNIHQSHNDSTAVTAQTTENHTSSISPPMTSLLLEILPYLLTALIAFALAKYIFNNRK